jgi:hypothetical protein
MKTRPPTTTTIVASVGTPKSSPTTAPRHEVARTGMSESRKAWR